MYTHLNKTFRINLVYILISTLEYLIVLNVILLFEMLTKIISHLRYNRKEEEITIKDVC